MSSFHGCCCSRLWFSSSGGPVSMMFKRKLHIGVPGLMALQFCLAIYGGYFGGGMGIVLLGVWTLLGHTDIHALNAYKTLLAGALNGAAVVLFILTGTCRVAWDITDADWIHHRGVHGRPHGPPNGSRSCSQCDLCNQRCCNDCVLRARLGTINHHAPGFLQNSLQAPALAVVLSTASALRGAELPTRSPTKCSGR